MKILNAKTLPQVYYGLHMVPGVAEYKDPSSGEPYRILIQEPTIKQMDASFAGRPVYVNHVPEVDLEKIHEADGYVIESFFNKTDGKHWVKFLVVSDRGHEAIRTGWKLSNAYVPKTFGAGGLNHGVEYLKEVTSGEYEHLAIVPNPRYEESVIMTPEQFKEYNQTKENELMRIANSQGEPSMLNFFKRSKVENTADLESTLVTLPKSKIEKSIAQLVNEADEAEVKKNEEQKEIPMANGDHMVSVGEEKMTVNQLVEKHMSMLEEQKKNSQPAAAEEKQNTEQKEEEKKENTESEVKEEKQNTEDKEEKKENQEGVEEKKENALHFDALKNAPNHAIQAQQPKIELSLDRVQRGQQRYGSGK